MRDLTCERSFETIYDNSKSQGVGERRGNRPLTSVLALRALGMTTTLGRVLEAVGTADDNHVPSGRLVVGEATFCVRRLVVRRRRVTSSSCSRRITAVRGHGLDIASVPYVRAPCPRAEPPPLASRKKKREEGF